MALFPGKTHPNCSFLVIQNNDGKSSEEIKLPVQIWDGVQDEEIPEINIIGKAGISGKVKKIRTCLSNSFAFGGSNACLIIAKGN